uniref:Uncharacterized protein n=1 Tax=Aegilops tauschii subsp. strangulata TaxID=200361 RepID=A0A453A5J1_AEGTS
RRQRQQRKRDVPAGERGGGAAGRGALPAAQRRTAAAAGHRQPTPTQRTYLLLLLLFFFLLSLFFFLPHLMQICNATQKEDKLPYAFYVGDEELSLQLGAFMQRNNATAEVTLRIVYQPQAVFRIRPVNRCSATIAGHTEAVLAVSFSPDGRCLASGSGDTTVRFWDLSTQTPLYTCKGHKNWVLCIAWSPDGKHLVSGSKSGELILWDPKTGNQLGAPLT